MCLSAIVHHVKDRLSIRNLSTTAGGIDHNQSLFICLTLLMLIALVGCARVPAPTQSAGAVQRTGTLMLPTQVPTLEPSPVNTRVMPLETFTVVPTSPLTPTMTPIPDEVRALVVEVFDGETIAVVMDGDPPSRVYQVRYLGIETPPNAPDSPWGTVAYETNRKLTNLKAVRLVRDQTDVDNEGHLWRYVYIGDELLNVILVEQGLARANVIEPDTRFRAEIEEAETRAKEGQLGLWGSPPTPTVSRRQAAGSGSEATAEPATVAPAVTSPATTTTPVLTVTTTPAGATDGTPAGNNPDEIEATSSPPAEVTAEPSNQ